MRRVLWLTFFCVLGVNSQMSDICVTRAQIEISAKEDALTGEIIIANDYTSSKGAGEITVTNTELLENYVECIIEINQPLKFKLKQSLHEVPDGPGAKLKLRMQLNCGNVNSVVVLTIDSVNDHPPNFEIGTYETDILQVMPAGFKLDLNILVTDRDSIESDDSDFKVTIKSGNTNEAFRLEQTDISDSQMRTVRVEIFVNNVNVMPPEGFYLLELSAKDEVHETNKNVKIEVKQLDMMNPIFQEQNYNGHLHFEEKDGKISVKETELDASTVVGNKYEITKLKPKAKIHAYDQDKFINQELVYQLVHNDESQWSNYFALEAEQKLYLVKTDPEFFKQKSVSFLIKATQTDNNDKSAFAMITFQIHLPPSTQELYFEQRIEILRRSKPNDEIYKVEIVGRNKDDQISLIEENELIELRDDTIYLKSEIPKTTDTFETEINVIRKGKLSVISSKIKVVFEVVDSEDCGLLDLPRAAHLVNVEAGTKKGDIVFQIKAKEKATYEVAGGDASNFSVDRESGNITLTEQLNSVYYHLDVLVESTQEPKKSITTRLLFEVAIKRALTTVFRRDVNHVDVPVDTVISTAFFKPEVEDKPGWIITYSATGGKDEEKFEVDTNGGVSLKNAIQTDKTYELQITATVTAPENLIDVTLIHFYGVEVKRSLTEIFTKSLYEVAVIECSEIGDTLFQIETVENTNPVFQITGGENTLFELNETTGEVKLNGQLVRDQTYELQVKAVQGNNQDKTKVIFQAIASEKCLLFTARNQSLEVSPSTPPGSAVLKLETTRDATFQIQGGEGFFEVNQNDSAVVVGKELEDDSEYVVEITATSTTNPPIVDSITVIFYVGKCAGKGQVSLPSLFSKSVYKVEIQDNDGKGSKLNLPPMNPEGISAKYMLVPHANEFELNENGELFLKIDPSQLEHSLYFLKVVAVRNPPTEASNYYDFNEIPDIGQDQALIIVTKAQGPVFLEPNPLLKLFLPTASLSDYVINIRTISKESPIEFTLKENEFFSIDAQSGTLYPTVDVTKTEVRRFKLMVVASSRRGLKAELQVEIIRLAKEETIVFTAEAIPNFNFKTLEEQLRNATGLRLVLMSYYETRPQVNYYDTAKPTANFAVAAFKREDDTLMTHDDFKSEIKEESISETIGKYETASLKDPLPGEKLVEYRNARDDSGGLVAAVVVLSILVALVLMAILGFFVLRKYKPSLLDKIRDKVDGADNVRSSKLTPPPSRRVFNNGSVNGSYDKSSYDNVGFQLNESPQLERNEQGLKETKLADEEVGFEPTTSTLTHVDEVKRLTNNASEVKATSDIIDNTNAPPLALYSAPMDAGRHQSKDAMETIQEAPSPLEKEDKGKKEALLQVPSISSDNQLQVPKTTNPGDDVEPDYSTEPEASSSRRGVTREDSFGLDIEEEEAPKAGPEVPEAFNDDLIDEEDVDTGEPGGTPHVHRKHIEIHVEEDISDDEEEAMLRKMAQIPQRKSVVTFSDKTEVIP